MKKLNFKELFSKNWIHLLAIGLFFAITFAYFQPQFSGYSLKQHDITQFRGMSNETTQFREHYGEEPLWTNSMFGGMPTYQISVDYSGNWVKKSIQVLRLWISSPAGYFFIYLIGFYIMLMCMKINPKVAIIGAIAFAFSTYFIIILQAGHNTKALAIGLAPPVIGAFYMAYRRSIKWGVLLSALFMGMQLGANHFQITYYIGILLLFMGVAELIRHIQLKQLKEFLIATIGILVAYGFALSINYGNIQLTSEYAQHTIRGGNDITINPDGTSNQEIQTTGLDKDYITQWSYGLGESFTLLSPYVKGGGSGAIKDSPFAASLKTPELRRKAKLVGENNVYWGDQPIVSGPVYLGITVAFLALLGLVYLKGTLKFYLLGAAILALMLSWGKNFMGLTDFFLDYIPGYNKFRAVTIILAVVEIIIPILGVLFLQLLIKEKESIKSNLRPFIATSISFIALMIVVSFTGIGDGYLSDQENEYVYNYESQVREQILQEDPIQLKEQYGIDIRDEQQLNEVVKRQSEVVNEQFDALVEVRQGIFYSSMTRSIFFLFLIAIILFVYIRFKVKTELFLAVLGISILLDLVPVNLNYLNNEKQGRGYKHWMEKEKANFPLSPTPADLKVYEQELALQPELKGNIESFISSSEKNSKMSKNEEWSKKFQALNFNTNYRVFEPSGGFSSSRASYFHKSIGGYHGAKLRRIQNLFDFQLAMSNMEVFNMLNVKYFLQGNQAQTNPGALGAAWLVKELQPETTENEELRALGNEFQLTLDNAEYTLKVNDDEVEQISVYGAENLSLQKNDKLINVDIQKAIRAKMNSTFVSDINGRTNWIPTKELAKDTLSSFTPILTLTLIDEFNPRQEAIISESISNELSSLSYTGDGFVKNTSYQPNKLEYNIQANGPQFIVFSEMYYPDGWTAYLNGKKVDIHRVNYLLRGIQVPDGEHTLEMKFEVPAYHTSNTVALAGSLLLFLLIAGAFVKDFLLPKKNN